MSQRISHVLSWLVLSTFFLFILISMSVPATAHAMSTKSSSAAIPQLNTNVICDPFPFPSSSNWTYTGNGPGSFGCGGDAWQTSTPTQDSAIWGVGTLDLNFAANYNLRAFITAPANAVMDYQIFVGDNLESTCVVNQNTALIGWNTVCSLSVSLLDVGPDITIREWSGQAHPGILSASAIQFLPN